MANHALDLNPPDAMIHLSTHGSDWLWAAFSFITVVLLIVIGLSFFQPRGTRTFHQLAIVILTTASISYFSMASDLGAAPIVVEFRAGAHVWTRQVWFVRYIQWFITFPSIVLSLLLTTGLSLSDVVTAIFMSIVVVITALVGSLVPSTYKWGYFTMGVVALFYVWYALLVQAPRSSFPGNGAFKTGYLLSAAFFSFILITYPVCWGLSEGGNVISPTSEMIWYGVLDCRRLHCIRARVWQVH
ncbi:hypothetical protein NM688_g3914 [Phlebia brevispora]|uniref:Uncharacterized protein n=1 Tax=Phlebia brevispora TaxID=194682 RepID=A0ACC1T4D9_9APHY|nr:hypothetical protein NM688_g3914 [Phlebia brevispora]